VTKQEKLQRAWHNFDDNQDHLPSSAWQACEWAVAAGLLQLPEIDPYDALAEDMAQALRAEYGTDDEGRRYRINHAVRVSKSGVQYTFWAFMDPEDRTTFVFVSGDLARRDLSSFEVPDRGSLPFDSRELLARLDEE
jgi:hypothetical protein